MIDNAWMDNVRPLTARQRAEVLRDWPALDPYGFHAVALAVLADFEDAVDKIVARLKPTPRAGRHFISFEGERFEVTGWDGPTALCVRSRTTR